MHVAAQDNSIEPCQKFADVTAFFGPGILPVAQQVPPVVFGVVVGEDWAVHHHKDVPGVGRLGKQFLDAGDVGMGKVDDHEGIGTHAEEEVHVVHLLFQFG